MQVEEMVFDNLERIEVPVKIAGSKYVLTEADEDAAVRVKNWTLRHAKLGSDGRPTSVGDIADSEPLLVSLCLYHAGEDGKLPLDKDGFPDPKYRVPLQVVKKWPARIVQPLYEKAQRISRLAPQDEDEEALRRQMVEIQGKLDKLTQGRNGQESVEKNSSSSTPST